MKAEAPRMTYTLAAVTVASYVIANAVGRTHDFAVTSGFIPARVMGLQVANTMPVILTPLTATLMHASLIHLGFNLLILVFCGKEVEVPLGRGGLAALYGVGAYAAAALQFAINPWSVVPMIGASGAVSALVGAYAILYGRRASSSRFSPEVARWLHIAWLAAAWIGLQLLTGIASRTDGMLVATAAHIGGFIAGLLLARPLLRWRYRKA